MKSTNRLRSVITGLRARRVVQPTAIAAAAMVVAPRRSDLPAPAAASMLRGPCAWGMASNSKGKHMNDFGALMGMGLGVALISGLIGLLIAVLLGALILLFACKLVVKSDPGYGKAVITMLAVIGAAIVVHIVLGVVLFWLGMLAGLIIFIVDFLVTAWLVQKLMKSPASSEISYGQACLVVVVDWLIWLAIGIVMWVIGMVIGFSFMHGMMR
ncbi:MAG: hypothetical protein ACYCOY_06670 [Metallibacterium sp.]